MSLINDALRRANKATTEQKTGSRDTVILKPIEYSQDRSLKSLLLVPLLLVGLFVVGGVIFWQFGIKDRAPDPAAASKQSIPPSQTQKPAQQAITHVAKPPSAKASQAPTKPSPAAPAVTTASIPAAREPAPIVMSPVVNSGPSTTPSAAANLAAPQVDKPIVKEPAKWPELELQAIFYRIKNPSVMINGQNLNIGDYIQGVRVHAIDRESATLELDGIRKVYKAK